ncbi:MAG: hypothetical protein ABI425_05795 [Patescibacteria group bacterium]
MPNLPPTIHRLFHKLKTKRRIKRRVLKVLFVLLICVAVFSYFTNPFVRFSLIVDPFHAVDYKDGQFVLEDDASTFVKHDAFFKQLALIKTGWHILNSRYVGGPKAKSGSVEEIIKAIHQLRFNPAQPFLISGDHFSMLYPRSLGIFYHSLMDPRTALDEQDWKDRQLLYLKTEAYALQVYENSDRLSTTIVPVAPRSVVLLNFYATPSDTLYSLLYGLKMIEDETTIERLYPYPSNVEASFALQTNNQAAQLLAQHKTSLIRQFQNYVAEVYNPQTGLIRRDITLSGTKDVTHRESAFYDNVIFWRTQQLAQELGLIQKDELFLTELKKKIIRAFWDDTTGVFLEDLSTVSQQQHAYSSDWLIVQMTGFLDPAIPEERYYFVRSVEYIQRNEIDQPFGLRYQADLRKSEVVGLVRLVAPTYGTTAIWSNWGQEYIKLLVRLGQTTGDQKYLDQAKNQLDAYTFNIKRYRGYPEVYDSTGDFFRTAVYKSVRQTGWVVSYEQAKAMYDVAIKRE